MERNSHVFDDRINEKHDGWTLSGCVFVHQSTRTVFTNNELRTIYKCIQMINYHHSTVYYQHNSK